MTESTPHNLAQLFGSLAGDGCVERLLAACIAEDLGQAGDITSRSLIDPTQRARAVIVLREAGVIAGVAVAPMLLQAFECSLHLICEAHDGDQATPGRRVLCLEGSLLEILRVERTLLNILGRLSGVASLTQHFVRAVEGTGAVICDTRKTTPGLRRLEKYAVACGGGVLHRLGLYDAALYKDNHLAALPAGDLASSLTAAIERVRSESAPAFVEVEVDTIEQLKQVLRIPSGLVDIVLLDNMDLSQLREAAALRNAEAKDLLLEASGGVRLDTVREIARTGVDRVSVGALTHAARSLDLSLEYDAP